MNAERKRDYGNLVTFGVIALFAMVLISIGLRGPAKQEALAAGGLESKIVERTCQFLQWEGTTIVACGDGFEFTLPFVEAPTPDQ